jgi:hypothetical protein
MFQIGPLSRKAHSQFPKGTKTRSLRRARFSRDMKPVHWTEWHRLLFSRILFMSWLDGKHKAWSSDMPRGIASTTSNWPPAFPSDVAKGEASGARDGSHGWTSTPELRMKGGWTKAEPFGKGKRLKTARWTGGVCPWGTALAPISGGWVRGVRPRGTALAPIRTARAPQEEWRWHPWIWDW